MALFNLLLIHFLALCLPGPDFFIVAATSVRRGIGMAIIVVLGITAGVAILASLSLLGMDVLFRTFPWSRNVIELLGGLFLFYLAWNMLKGGDSFTLDQAQGTQEPVLKSFSLGLLTNLSNPKALLYFASIFSSTGLVSGQSFVQNVPILVLIVVETLLYFCLIATIFSSAPARSFYARYSRLIDRVASLIFMGFAIFFIGMAIATYAA